MSTAKIVLFHQGSTELRRCENCVFFLPVNILTGVTRRLLGPHDTLPCVLIYLMQNSTKRVRPLKRLWQKKCEIIVVIKIITISLPSQPFLGCHLGFHIFFHHSLFKGRTLFLQLGCFGLDFTSFCICIHQSQPISGFGVF